MESANKKVILIAFVLALLTTFLIYIYLTSLNVKPQLEEKVNIYVAANTMPARYMITKDDLKAEVISKDLLNENLVLNKSEVIGKRIRDRIIEGEQILKSRLLDSQGLSLSYNIPEGKRAISITVDEQSEVSGLLRPGDYVDVFVNIPSKDPWPQNSKNLVQNVQVLALSQDQVIVGEKLSELPKTITLAVNPEDVAKILYSTEYGRIILSLRAVGDEKLTEFK
jgi:pilus assembly protein CpaB